MFENVGQKIKDLAKICYTIGVLISVFIGIWACIVLYNLLEDIVLALFSAGLVVGVGIFFSWLSILLLYAFGDLVLNTSKICAKLCSAENTLSSDSCNQTVSAISMGEANIKCTNCGRVQFKGNKVCSQCGAKLVNLEHF